MAEPKGFFRRIFSFGAPPEEFRAREADRAPETAPPADRPAPTPVAAEETPPAAALPEPRFPEAEPLGERPAAPKQSAPEPFPPEPDRPPASDVPPVTPADHLVEPGAVPAEAEEDDFSWLDAPLPPEEIEPAAPAPDGPLPELEDGTLADPAQPQAVRTPDAVLDETPDVRPAQADDHLGAPNEVPLDGHDGGDDEGADFSWLEAPLPPEEEDETPAVGAPAFEPGTGIAVSRGFELAPAAAPAARVPFFQRLREGLSRSSGQLSGSITSIFAKRKLDEEVLQDFEDVLIKADLGVETAMRITDRLSDGRFGREISGAEVRRILSEEVEKALLPVALPLELDLSKKPHVILVVGVNGTGKTTTIGKLTAKLTRAGLKVTLGAGDTFRAAAVEQLKIWGERTGAPVVSRAIGADAAGLAYDAYEAALANGSDVLIIDTAGRLQNKAELMAELEKIVRVLQKREPDAPHTVLQTLDATTGQNALSQVEIFRNVAGVNGLVMTKLDGTARGGILVAIAAKFRLPVFFIGVGEGIDDLEPFKARDFAQAIAGSSPDA
ncbi:signal recognition particle-docking protein FtsY [Aurantimonas sp. Leaf443]|uniref:signal recognition particle-docking protein FtsY n=1 Tax=Aurantimonas sp. Leaf443 TaxID=1736378 RepID=UPI0006FE1B11|nr:signal recognition particle-docking protein FtsY [Aurantimonas sp. Leaf443]KQT82228.1 hypothetical protein ASG48_16485 [Aurantimonas sp. Leaf443]